MIQFHGWQKVKCKVFSTKYQIVKKPDNKYICKERKKIRQFYLSLQNWNIQCKLAVGLNKCNIRKVLNRHYMGNVPSKPAECRGCKKILKYGYKMCENQFC